MNSPRVLVTRSAHQASSLATELQMRGAVPVLVPAIELVAPADEFRSLDQALGQLERFAWLVFTSGNAVEAFSLRLGTAKLPASLRLASIGAMTARAISQHLGPPAESVLLPPTATAESLAAELTRNASGDILLVRAQVARDVLPDTLRQSGFHVTIADAYRNLVPQSSVDRLRQVFADPELRPHAVTFTSASTVHHTLELLAAAGLVLEAETVLASIGPITSAALQANHLPVHVEAPQTTVASLADELLRYLQQKTSEPAS